MNSNRRDFVKQSAAIAAASVMAAVAPSATAAAPRPASKNPRKKPNLVYVFPDQMRRHAMGFMKQDPVITPNLDAFAKHSVVLDNACSTYPICSPHRASLLTGQYTETNGVYTNARGDRPDVFLKPETECFTDVLHNSGYHVGYIGKWHLERGNPGMGYASPWVSPDRRHNIDFWHVWCDTHRNQETGELIGWESSHFSFGYWENDGGPEDRIFPGPIWSPIYETNTAIDYINNRNGERDEDKPFALFVSWNPPHNPYNSVPENYVSPYRDAQIDDLLNRPNVRFEGRGADSEKYVRGYLGAVSGVDDQFGRILEAIDQAGIEEETIVIFTSDHGEMMGSHGAMGKTVFWEESFGVPFMISWPGHLEARHEELLIGTPDIMPTVLGLMGLGGRIPESVEGSNYSPAIHNTPGAERPEFTWYYNAWNARGVRTKDTCGYFYRDGEGDDVDHYYDLKNDPYQLENRSADRPREVAALGRETKEWMRGLDDRFTHRIDRGKDYIDSIPG